MSWIPLHRLTSVVPAPGPVQAMPSNYTPAPHGHAASEITGLPSTWTPSAHTHPLSAHTHPMADISGLPSTYTPAVHAHDWTSIQSKPQTFTPSSHTHAAADVVGLQNGGSTGFLVSTTSTLVFLPNGAERVVVMAKGSWSGSNAAQTIALLGSNVTKDAVSVRQAATTDSLPYYLQYTETPSASTLTIQMRATAGALANTSIIAMRFN